MSIKLMSAVWGMKLNHTDKLVLLALADNANDDGICWPSIRTICKKTCLSERGVQASLQRLIQTNTLQRIIRNGRSSNFYVRPPPPQDMHPAGYAPTPAQDAPPPPQDMHPTPARHAPRTIIEPSSEPSKNPNGAAEVLPMDFFERFWEEFPRQRRGSREKALKAYRLASKRTTQETIHEAVIRYSASSDVKRGFAKGAAAWLNDDRWQDQPITCRETEAANGKRAYGDSLQDAAANARRVLDEKEAIRAQGN